MPYYNYLLQLIIINYFYLEILDFWGDWGRWVWQKYETSLVESRVNFVYFVLRIRKFTMETKLAVIPGYGKYFYSMRNLHSS